MTVSALQSFTRQSRLLSKHDFGRVFDTNTLRASNRYALFLARPNQGEHSRLGLVIAKKHVRTAVQRNRVKRIVREFFRRQHKNEHLDVVFLARAKIDELSSQDIHSNLDGLWSKLVNTTPVDA